MRLWPAARLGCVLGWLAAAPLAAVGTVVVVVALRALDAMFDRVEPVTLSLAGREMLRIDLLEQLGLSGAADWVGTTADLSALAGIALFLALVLGSGALTALGVVSVAAGYNLLASAGLALEVEVRNDEGAPPGALSPARRPELPLDGEDQLATRRGESGPS